MQDKKITGQQIRAARGVLGWSIDEFAKISTVGAATLKRYELVDSVPKSRKDNLEKIKQAFERHGIEFIGTPNDAPGIRIHKI